MPTSMEACLITPLLKPYKNKVQAVSYRTVSLVSCPGKVLEHIVTSHTMRHFNELEILTKNNMVLGPQPVVQN